MKKQKIQWKRSKFKWFFWWALAPNHTHTLNILHGFISFSWLLQNRLPVWLTGWLLACDVVIKVWQSRPPIKFNSHAIHTHRHSIEEDEDEKTSQNHINCIISSILVQAILPVQDHFDCNFEIVCMCTSAWFRLFFPCSDAVVVHSEGNSGNPSFLTANRYRKSTYNFQTSQTWCIIDSLVGKSFPSHSRTLILSIFLSICLSLCFPFSPPLTLAR